MWNSAFLSIVCAGLAATVGQVLILRELLVLFLGNELSAGLVFFSWLLWTAAGSAAGASLSRRGFIGPAKLAESLMVLSVALPLTIVWIRASRLLWSIPTGELLSPGVMAAIAFSATSLFCLMSGALFAFAWACASTSQGPDVKGPTVIYLGEAAGSAVGGLLFYFVLLPCVTALQASLCIAAFLFVAGLAVLLKVPAGIAGKQLLVASVAGVFLCVAVFLHHELERASRKAQWGPDVVAVRDTPFHNLALLRRAEQFSLFANGQWLFSVPDPQTTEFSIHPTLLHHPAPKHILVIGGELAGLVREILKHPMIEAVDAVEPDPEVLRITGDSLPGEATQPLRDPRVRILHKDAGSVVRSATRRYDVILSNVGDPLSAGTNRFYTKEFFERVRGLLQPGGIVSFPVTSSPDMVGARQAMFLQSIREALRGAFPWVLIYPGESALFMASSGPDVLQVDPDRLIEHLRERQLELRFVQDYTLRDRMGRMRVDAFQSALEGMGGPTLPVNEDFRPSCYYYGLAVWSAQVHPSLGAVFVAAAGMSRGWTWLLVAAGSLGLSIASAVRRPRPRWVVALCVFLVGGGQMALQVLLLVAFQVLVGFVYRELALIITMFMVGIAVGAAVAGSRGSAAGTWGGVGSTGADGSSREILNDGGLDGTALEQGRRIRGFLTVQVLFGLNLLLVMGTLHALHHGLEKEVLASPAVSGIFAGLAFVAGLLGGIHFSVAVGVLGAIRPGRKAGGSGPALYALDLVGAAGGALGVSLFLLPVHGIHETIGILALATLAGAIPLSRCR